MHSWSPAQRRAPAYSRRGAPSRRSGEASPSARLGARRQGVSLKLVMSGG